MNKIIIQHSQNQHMHARQMKRHSAENRKISAYRLPPISKEKHVVLSSKKKIPEANFLVDLKRASSQYRNSQQRIPHSGKRKLVDRSNGHITGHEKIKQSSQKNLINYRIKTESPTNQYKHVSFDKFTNEEENVQIDKTLENFQKNVKENRQQIHSQINKRKKIGLKQKNNTDFQSQKGSSPGYHDIYQSGASSKGNSKYIKQGKLNSNRKNRRNTTTSADQPTSPQVFIEIQKIINNKISSMDSNTKIDLNHVQHSVKLAKLIQNIRKLSPQKSISELQADMELEKSMLMHNSDSNMSTSRNRVLKNQNNYHEWRRVDLSQDGSDQPNYKHSTFEIENERLEQFILKNQISLSKYLQSRKELLKFKTNKVKTSIA